MAEPFLAQITIVGFNFAPRGYAKCDGQILPINQNQSLYSLLGTTYGGDGRTSFALPDLRGRVPIHEGNSNTHGSGQHNLGHKSGEESHALTIGEIPSHDHSLQASGDQATTGVPANDKALASRALFTAPFYGTPPESGDKKIMSDGTIGHGGGGQGHQNTQPSIAINFVIAIQGVFPSRN